jgi:hypothetical protein
MSEHEKHDVVMFAEKFDPENPKIHAGICWCNDCETEFAPKRKEPARTQ